MTKLKSKKASKSTLALIVAAILIVALLAFGGTYAFFTATANSKGGNALTVGKVDLAAGDVTITTTSPIVTGDTILSGALVYTTNPTVNELVVVKFSAGTATDLFEITPYSDFTKITGLDESTGEYYYAKVAANAAGSLTFIDDAITVEGDETYLQSTADALARVKAALVAEIEATGTTAIATVAGDDWASIPLYLQTELTTAYNAGAGTAEAINAVTYKGETGEFGKSITISIQAKSIQFRGLPAFNGGTAITVDNEAAQFTSVAMTTAQSAAHELFNAALAPVAP